MNGWSHRLIAKQRDIFTLRTEQKGPHIRGRVRICCQKASMPELLPQLPENYQRVRVFTSVFAHPGWPDIKPEMRAASVC